MDVIEAMRLYEDMSRKEDAVRASLGVVPGAANQFSQYLTGYSQAKKDFLGMLADLTSPSKTVHPSQTD